MSLRSFHLLFIGLSIVLTVFFAVWAVGQYQEARGTAYLAVTVGSLAASVALAVYGAAFQRKTRGM